MISFGSCIYPTLGSVKVSPSRVASPENYKHQTLKVSGVTPRPELPPITLNNATKIIVTAVEADSIHLDAFASRKCLWQRIKTSPAFSELVSKLILGYVDLYKAHRKGKNKYSRFLVSWHEFFSRYAVQEADGSDEEKIWQAISAGDDGLECQSTDRSAIITAIAKAVYELLTEKATQFHRQNAAACLNASTSDTMYPQSRSPIPDDDASIVRVVGFALHSAIKYRSDALAPINSQKHNTDAQHRFGKELELLKRMKCPDDAKSFMPSVVKFQDRGGMTVMRPEMLEFGRSVFASVKSTVNYTSYMSNGSDIFKLARENVIGSSELLQTFKSCLQNIPHSSEQASISAFEEAIVSSTCVAILTKMLHTINNDFLTNISLLDKIDTGKGTGAKLLLRDKLKASAADIVSWVSCCKTGTESLKSMPHNAQQVPRLPC